MNSGKLLAKIIEKWPAKIISLIAAIIISVFYRMISLETRTFIVPLKVNANDLLIPASSLTDTVRIKLRGESNSVFSILEDDIEAYIDLDKYTNEGTYRIPVQIRKKNSALGIEPLEISVLPIEINLLLEQKVRRNIPVIPLFSGTVAQGYDLTDQSITPEKITAEGPRTRVDLLHELNTETINLEGRNETFSVLINIINNNPLITIYGNRMIEYHGIISQTGFKEPDDSDSDFEDEDGGETQ